MEDPLKLSHHQHHAGPGAASSLKGKSQPGTPNKTVNFKISPVCEKEREKFLTAKYGAHQMALIRKRLKVEMWMYDHLQKLFSSEVGIEIKKKAHLRSKMNCIIIISRNE